MSSLLVLVLDPVFDLSLLAFLFSSSTRSLIFSRSRSHSHFRALAFLPFSFPQR